MRKRVDRQTFDAITQKHKELVEAVRPPIVTDQDHDSMQHAEIDYAREAVAHNSITTNKG